MRNNRGFSLFEITIAFLCVGLIAIPIGGFLITHVQSQGVMRSGVTNQQETARLVNQLTEDIRFSKSGIEKNGGTQLIIHSDTARYITYAYENGFLKRWESPTMTAAQSSAPSDCTYYPSQNSGTAFSGTAFTFQYFDKANQDIPLNTATDSICAVSLTGARIGGSQVAVSIPPLTVANRYAIEKDDAGDPFDYCLFSGNSSTPLTINCNNLNVSGKIHSNQNAAFNCNNFAMNDTCEAVGTIVTKANHAPSPDIFLKAAQIAMPDRSDLEAKIKTLAGTKVYTGDKVYAENNVDLNGSIYVNGKVTITCNNVTDVGSIFATDGIEITANTFTPTNQNPAYLYSKKDIVVKINNFTAHGVLYAPNGAFQLQANNFTVYGQVIADTMDFKGINNFNVTRTCP
ncbi:MAG TPA: hypothetical protein DD435_07180 [Cyanobacteria bacterium UBA8530]|nr:hypothetical protein [Cyanobacteria bacterium UBA8530]